MKRIIVLFILVYTCPLVAKPYCDSLANDLQAAIHLKETRDALKAIANSSCANSFKLLSGFALGKNKLSAEAITYMNDFQDDLFISWVKENKGKFSGEHWVGVAKVTNTNNKRRELLNLLIDVSERSNDKYVRDMIRVETFDYWNLEQVYSGNKCLNIETSQKSRLRLYGANARFKSEQTDSVLNLLFKGNEQMTIEWVAKYSLKDYNRYDLLPELFTLKEKIENLKDASEKSNWNRVLKSLNKTIPYLEEKKKEKAEIGLPLDWGLEKGESK